MKKSPALLTSAFLCVLIFVFAVSSWAMPCICVPTVAKAPVIDGDLSEWDYPAPVSSFVKLDSMSTADRQTRAWIARDAETLFVACWFEEPSPSKLKAEVKVSDGKVWQDDGIEILINPVLSGDRFFQIVVNSLGVIYDGDTGEPDWSSGAKAAARLGKDCWSIEVAIPFTSLGGVPEDKAAWGMNLARERHVNAPEVSTWSYASGRIINPTTFGRILFRQPPAHVSLTTAPRLGYGYNEVSLDLASVSDGSASVFVDLSSLSAPRWSLSGGFVSLGGPLKASLQVNLASAEERTVTINCPLKGGWENSVQIVVSEKEGSPAFWTACLPVDITPPSQIDTLDMYLGNLKGRNSRPPNILRRLEALTSNASTVKAEFDNLVSRALQEKRKVTEDEWKQAVGDIASQTKALLRLSNQIWSKDPWENYSPWDCPEDIDNMQVMRLTSCMGQTLSACLMITDLGNIRKAYHQNDWSNVHGPASRYRLRCFGLTSKGAGAVSFTIPNTRIVLREAQFQSLKDGSVYSDPLPLARSSGDFLLPAGQTRQMWFSIDAKDIPPGTYEGIIELRPLDSEAPIKKVKIVLQILPVQLPVKMPIASWIWEHSHEDAYVRDLMAHRINHLFVSTLKCFPLCDKEGNVLSVDYRAHDNDLRTKRKYGAKIVYAYGVVRDFDNYVASKHKWVYMSKPWKKAFTEWLSGWIRHIKQMGLTYDDFSMQIWDEASGENARKVAQVGTLLRKIDPGVRWVMDGSQGLEDLKIMAPYVDIWIPHMDALLRAEPQSREAKMAFYHSTRKPVWGYTCRTQMIRQPLLEYYRVKPWYAWDLGLDGVSFWAYNSWRGDSWLDADAGSATHSDNGVVYDGINGPVTTRRWEAYRDGLEDYLCLYLLRETGRKAKALGRKADSDKAEGLIKKAVAQVLADPNNGRLLLSMRGQIVQAIIEINSRLSNKSPTEPMVRTISNGAIISWRHLESCVTEVFYRLRGSLEWSKASSRTSSVNPEIKLSNLMAGQVYEWFALSITSTGFVIPDKHIRSLTVMKKY